MRSYVRSRDGFPSLNAEKLLNGCVLIALTIALSGCAAQRVADSVDADYRRGDRIARLADDHIACRRAGGILLARTAGRVARAGSGPQTCVRPGSLRKP